MRWLLATLFLLNGVAFYWFSNRPLQPAESSEAVPGGEVRRLLLLSEKQVVESLEPAAGEPCVVVGPIAELSFRQWLSEELSYAGVRFQVWPERVVEAEGRPPAERYWLQFHAARQGQLSEQLRLNIQANSPQSKIEEKTCSVVASGTDIP